MSKSRGNVVDPNEVVDQYGADVLRTYILFMGDYGAAAPWDVNGIKGCKRFLDRVEGLFAMAKGNGSTPELESIFHKTVKKVTLDIEEMKFNTAIAAMMTLLNEIYTVSKITVDELKTLVLILCPFAPHLSEELWEKLGGKGLCAVASWPEWDEKKCEDKSVEIAIQVLGKLKGTVTVAVDADKETVLDLVKKDERILPLIEGKTIVKEIYVPGKIVNIVVK